MPHTSSQIFFREFPRKGAQASCLSLQGEKAPEDKATGKMPVLLSKNSPAHPFPILSPEEAADCPNAVPIFDIKIAARDFSKEQWLQDCQYAALPDHFTTKPGFFPAQVAVESMNRRIPNGSWRLFREPSAGSRNGKVVIVQSRDIQDPDTGGQSTVKIYRSEKTETEDSWSHRVDPDPETDLVTIAQFHCNQVGGKGALTQRIFDEFSKTKAPTENHRILSRLPIQSNPIGLPTTTA